MINILDEMLYLDEFEDIHKARKAALRVLLEPKRDTYSPPNEGQPTMNKLNAVEHLLSDARGIYIPQNFVEMFDREAWGLSDPKFDGAWEVCAEGCEAECVDWFWEEWDEILNHAEYKCGDHTWYLHHDGNLWAVCPELMTNEEKKNFGWEIDEDDEEEDQ